MQVERLDGLTTSGEKPDSSMPVRGAMSHGAGLTATRREERAEERGLESGAVESGLPCPPRTEQRRRGLGQGLRGGHEQICITNLIPARRDRWSRPCGPAGGATLIDDPDDSAGHVRELEPRVICNV